MSWIECLLIMAGLLLDVFAAMEIQGSMLSNIKKRSLIIACVVVVVIEIVFYFAGYITCMLLSIKGYIADPTNVGEIVSVILFALLGIRLIIKALSREFIQERRKDNIRVWDYIKIIIVSSIYTAATGCAFGLVGVTIWQIVAIIVILSILVVLCGLYTGLHFGFEKKTIAYAAGAILLWVAGAEILLHRVLEIL